MSRIKRDKAIKVLFMGTPEFAVPGLLSLISDQYFKVIGVYTKPDKPQGRKQNITPPPIKIVAEKNNIPVFQPEKIKPEIDNIKNLNPDLIVVIAYGKIIPPEILDIPKYGCINVHGSLLPKYRGSSCLSAPIINGDDKTGITIMKMDATMDTGDILKQFEIPLDNNANLEYVHDSLSNLSAQVLKDVLKDWIEEKIETEKQDESQASYVKMIKKEDGHINWHKNAQEIERLIRGLNPWPGTYSYVNNKIIKIFAAQVDNDINENNRKIGEIFIKNKHLTVKCGQGNLFILKLQTEGGKIMSAQDFLSGHQDIIGKVLQ